MVKTPNREPRFLTATQLACEIGCTERHIYNLVRRGELTPTRFGRATRFERHEIERLVKHD